MADEIQNINVIKKLGCSEDRQGKVSLCEGEINGVRTLFITKVPKKIGFLSDHEAQIIKDLNTLNLPHFCKYYYHDNHKIYMEYVSMDGELRSLDSFLAPSSYDFDTAMNLIKQVVMALAVAQKHLQFTHYDLHCDNVLVKSVPKNSVYLYVIDDDNQFCVPTNGLCSVIIDYGYSYTKNTGSYGSLEFTEFGYTPVFFDAYIDCIRFLITTSRISRREYKIFRNVVRNLFPLSESISMSSGWFKSVGGRNGILDGIREKLGEITSSTCILYKKCIQSLMILQGLVKRGFDYPYTNLSADYYRFSQEFEKLTCDKAPKDKLEILKKIVVATNDDIPFENLNIETDYKEFGTLKEYVNTLRNSLSGYVTQLSKSVENKKKEVYSQLKHNTEQIFGALDFNFHSEFVFDTSTKIYMWKDCKMVEFSIPGKYLRKINKTIPPLRGTLLYDIYRKELENEDKKMN